MFVHKPQNYFESKKIWSGHQRSSTEMTHPLGILSILSKIPWYWLFLTFSSISAGNPYFFKRKNWIGDMVLWLLVYLTYPTSSAVYYKTTLYMYYSKSGLVIKTISSISKKFHPKRLKLSPNITNYIKQKWNIQNPAWSLMVST